MASVSSERKVVVDSFLGMPAAAIAPQGPWVFAFLGIIAFFAFVRVPLILRPLRSEPIETAKLDWTKGRMRTMHIESKKHARDCQKTMPQENDVSRVGAPENSTIWTLQIVGVVVCPTSHCRTLENRRGGFCRSGSLGRRRMHDRWRLCRRVTGRRSPLSRRKV
jgi:hypothetical protein